MPAVSTDAESDPIPAIQGMGVAVLECPREFSPADVESAVSARWPDAALLTIDGNARLTQAGKPSSAFAGRLSGTTWKNIDVWCDEDLLGPSFVISRPGTKLPFYARAWFAVNEPGAELSDPEVARLGDKLREIVDELTARHGVVVIDFEPNDELRRSPYEL